MTVSSLALGIIQTENYYDSRIRDIRAACLHTGQCPCQLGRGRFLMEFLRPASRRASAHYGVDFAEVWAGAQEEHTCFAAPGLNADGIHIEQAAYAEFGSPGWQPWDDPLVRKMVHEKTVPLLVDVCRRNRLPAKLLEPAQLLDPTARGITDHWRCTKAFGGSHWDCGHHYPIQQVIDLVAKQLGTGPTPIPTDEDDMKIVTDDKGTIWLVGGNTRRKLISADTWGNTKWAIDQLLEHGVASEWINPAGGVPLGALERIPEVTNG